MKSKINILDDSTIVKIAAGEIIENPASIIKELVENSIDASSDKISIEIKNKGKDLIKVEDNGEGFKSPDLDLAFKRHATSKINKLIDLKETNSLGFRGEALSSIAYVSDILVITKSRDSSLGIKARVDKDGNIYDKEEIVSQNGTTIFCKNLFDSIPVRNIYLSSRNYEINKTNDIITRLALSSPNIAFEYYNDDKLILKTSPKNGMKNNLYSVLGSDIADQLEYIEHDFKDFSIKAYLSNNMLYRSNRSNQFIFVNGRSIENTDIRKSIEEAYKSIIPLNKFPLYLLYIDIDNEFIDVNIHPKKNIIKFTNIEDIDTSLYKLIRNKLFASSKIYDIEIPERSIDKKEETIFEKYSSLADNNTIVNMRDLSKDNENLDHSHYDQVLIEDNFVKEETKSHHKISSDYNYDQQVPEIFPNGYRYIGSFLNKYLLLEDSIDQDLYFLDQHAAHERINYEKFRRDYENNQINRQRLLSGYVIDFSTRDFEYILSIKDLLYDLGIEIDEFGNNSIIVRSVPVYLEDFNPELLFDKLLEEDKLASNLYEIDPYKIMKMACSASIKTGDYISLQGVNKLINGLKKTKYPLTCPHGRPTMIKISQDQLDKEFYRIQNG